MSAATQRTEKINKLFKVAKKHFHAVQPPANRLLIEHLLYACCLENATFETADEVLARLQDEYFDWNEIRVTTSRELAELLKKLPDPEEAANRVRRTLQGLFEAHYSFDVEQLRKENLGKAIEQIQKYSGVTPFGVAYVTQSVLGGHSIPIDESMMLLMQVLGIASDEDAASNHITGLERAISKDQGIEFFSIVHQLAVALHASPFNKDVRAIILEIDKTAIDRFPKRQSKKKSVEDSAPAIAETPEKPAAPEKPTKAKPVTKDKKAKPVATEPPKVSKKESKAVAAAKSEKSKTTKPKVGSQKKPAAAKPAPSKSVPAKSAAKKPAKKDAKRKPR